MFYASQNLRLTLASSSPPTLRNAMYCLTPSIRFWNSTLATFMFEIIEPWSWGKTSFDNLQIGFLFFSYFLYAGVWKFISSLATHLYFQQWWRKSTRQPRSQQQRTNIRSRFQALESRQLSLAWVLTSKSCRCIVVWVTHSGCLCERVKRRRNLIIQLRSALRLLCLTWDVRTSIHMRSLCEIWWKINHASSYDHHITAATALVETNYHLNYTPNCHCQILEHNLWRNRDRHSNELKLILLARPRCKHREER